MRSFRKNNWINACVKVNNLGVNQTFKLLLLMMPYVTYKLQRDLHKKAPYQDCQKLKCILRYKAGHFRGKNTLFTSDDGVYSSTLLCGRN